jgi:hypothetical protein
MSSKDSEIVLLSETFNLQDITSRESRENLYKTINTLGLKNLTEEDIQRYFHGMRLAMLAFIQKVGHLESDVFNLRKDQATLEAKMEAMYLRAQLEISSLRNELNEVKFSKERLGQIVKVAKTLQGNAYAPYAIKSMVDGVMKNSSNNSTNYSTTLQKNLPSDFTTRLYFAQSHGFKWNQNNREPAKASKKLQLLEEWENQFCKVESLTTEQLLDKKYMSSIGPGAVAGALIALEREIGVLQDGRETLSIFNCYQKAIRLYKEKQSGKVSSDFTTKQFDYKAIVEEAFPTLEQEDLDTMAKRLESGNYATIPQSISGIKKLLNKKVLPAFAYEKDHKSSTSRLYALQDSVYDAQFEALIKKYEYRVNSQFS